MLIVLLHRVARHRREVIEPEVIAERSDEEEDDRPIRRRRAEDDDEGEDEEEEEEELDEEVRYLSQHHFSDTLVAAHWPQSSDK